MSYLNPQLSIIKIRSAISSGRLHSVSLCKALQNKITLRIKKTWEIFLKNVRTSVTAHSPRIFARYFKYSASISNIRTIWEKIRTLLPRSLRRINSLSRRISFPLLRIKCYKETINFNCYNMLKELYRMKQMSHNTSVFSF